MLDKVLDKIKEIVDIEKFDNTKILIDTNKLPDGITIKNVLILMACVRKNGDKFYPQIFKKKALLVA